MQTIEAKIAAGRRTQGLMMPAGRIALQIARAAAPSTVWTRAVSSAAAAAEQQQGSVVQCSANSLSACVGRAPERI
jgi:hypothetical protein